MATDNSPQTTLPLIRGYTRPGIEKREIALWPNMKKNVPDDAWEKMSEADKSNFEKIPDFQGSIRVTKNGVDREISVSGWLESGADPANTRIKLMTNINFGNYLLGSIKANTTFNQQPADGAFGLKLSGKLKVQLDGQSEDMWINGGINGRYPDKQLIDDVSHILGFPEKMINDFQKKMDITFAQQARVAADDTRPKAAAMAL